MEKGELLTTNEKYAILCKDSFSLVIKELEILFDILISLLESDSMVAAIEKCNSRPGPGRREKMSLTFYFYTSLWCLKRFYEGFKGFKKTFWGTTKKVKKKRLNFYFNTTFRKHGTGRIKGKFEKPALFCFEDAALDNWHEYMGQIIQ